MQALALGHTGSSGDSVPAVHHRIPYTMSGHDYSQTTTAIPSLKKAVHAQRTVGAWLAPAQSASPSGSRSGALRRAARSLGARASMRQKDILAILEVAALTRESLIVLIAARHARCCADQPPVQPGVWEPSHPRPCGFRVFRFRVEDLG